MSEASKPHSAPDAPDFKVVRDILRHCHPKFPEARYQLEQAEAALTRIEEAMVDGFNHEQGLLEQLEALQKAHDDCQKRNSILWQELNAHLAVVLRYEKALKESPWHWTDAEGRKWKALPDGADSNPASSPCDHEWKAPIGTARYSCVKCGVLASDVYPAKRREDA